MSGIAKRYDNFELLVVEVSNLNNALIANTNTLNSLVTNHLFRIRNTNTLLQKKDNRDSVTSRKLEAGLLEPTRNKETSLNGKIW